MDVRRRAGDRARARRRPSSTPAARPLTRDPRVACAARSAALACGIARRARCSSARRRGCSAAAACATGSTASAPRGAARRSSSSRASLTVALFPGPLLAGAERAAVRHRARHPGLARRGDARRVAAPSRSRAAWAHDAVDAAGRAARLRRCATGSAGAASCRVLYARLAPGMPYTLVNYAAGLTPVRLPRVRRRDRARRRPARVRLHRARRLVRRPGARRRRSSPSSCSS